MNYIYLVTNQINGKQYIGQHHYDGDGIDVSYKGSGKLLKQAYQKYGISNFKIEILEYCTDTSIDELEIKWIRELNTQTPNGYNIRSGGNGWSESDRLYLSSKAKERYKDPQKRKEIAEHLARVKPKEHKEKIFICPLKLAYLNTQQLFLQELGNVFGCDKRIVKRRAEKYGIKLNPRHPWSGRTHSEKTKEIMRQNAIDLWKKRKS